ncbi:MAG: nirD [Betaproteobacteria bacterium]|nr:nirD [Betaproteobacteria bacterium]
MDQPLRVTVTAETNPAAYLKEEGFSQMAEVNVSGWQQVCALDAIPELGARVVKSAHGNIAVFRNAENEVFALLDKCPHKGGPLSQGIVFGRKVACPLHGWNIGLDDGNAVAPDVGCARSFQVKVDSGQVWLEV